MTRKQQLDRVLEGAAMAFGRMSIRGELVVEGEGLPAEARPWVEPRPWVVYLEDARAARRALRLLALVDSSAEPTGSAGVIVRASLAQVTAAAVVLGLDQVVGIVSRGGTLR